MVSWIGSMQQSATFESSVHLSCCQRNNWKLVQRYWMLYRSLFIFTNMKTIDPFLKYLADSVKRKGTEKETCTPFTRVLADCKRLLLDTGNKLYSKQRLRFAVFDKLSRRLLFHLDEHNKRLFRSFRLCLPFFSPFSFLHRSFLLLFNL